MLLAQRHQLTLGVAVQKVVEVLQQFDAERFVAKAAPDGYTLLMVASGPIVINPVLYAKVPYDPVKDLVPVSQILTYQYALVTLATSPPRRCAAWAELSRSERVRRVRGGDRFVPGLECVAAPGHTPGHLLLYLHGNPSPVLFTGDAAKNRAELLSREVDATGDADASRRSIDLIWDWWRRAPDTVLVPGHDLSMRLDADGQPQYIGERKAGIAAWYSESIRTTSTFDLSGRSQASALNANALARR